MSKSKKNQEESNTASNNQDDQINHEKPAQVVIQLPTPTEPKTEKGKMMEIIKDYAPSVVALIAIIFNIIQYIQNNSINNMKTNAETNTQHALEEKTKLENEKIADDNKISKYKTQLELSIMKPSLQGDFIFYSGLGVLSFAENSKTVGLINNTLWDNMQSKIENWNSGDRIIEKKESTELSHGLLTFQIQNTGNSDAIDIVINLRKIKLSPQGEQKEEPSLFSKEILKSGKLISIPMKNLPKNKKITILIGHLLGSTIYYDEAYFPESISWHDKAGNSNFIKNNFQIEPKVNWQIQGANIYFAQ